MNEAVINRLRLTSGLVMFAYVTLHLINLSLGLISVEAMDVYLSIVTPFWDSLPVTLVLGGSLITHIALAMRSLYRRSTLRMPFTEAMQLSLGFLIPFLLALHLTKTRISMAALGTDIEYRWELLNFLVLDKVSGVQQVILLIAAWGHGCIGVNFNLRYRRFYPRWKPWLLLGAVMLPVLALLGFFEAGRTIMALAQNQAWYSMARAASHVKTADAGWFVAVTSALRWSVLIPLLGVVSARVLRWLHGRHLSVVISYPAGRSIRVARGTSVLEASRLADIPHASVCGGRGRCSTCRVVVTGAIQAIPVPGPAEAQVLTRLKLPEGTRLACQLRPTGDLAVTPLLAPGDAARAVREATAEIGSERDLAIMFCDLRGFTQLSEKKLPYDTVFLLNGYFAEMGKAIEAHGGHIDKFIGDGIMAIFGIDGGTYCADALSASAAMSQRLNTLNEMLRAELPAPLRIGIGIHCGPVVLGEMGYGRAKGLTVIGDTVNMASRLEEQCKTQQAELVISDAVERHAGLDLRRWPQSQVVLRGTSAPLTIRAIDCAAGLENGATSAA